MRLDIIGRMLLGGAIRRALWRSPRTLLILAALVGLALMSMGTARAQQLPCQTANQCDKGVAFEACMAQAPPPGSTGPRCFIRSDEPSAWLCEQTTQNGSLNFCGWFRFRQCPPDAPWDEDAKRCKPPPSCRIDDPSLGPSWFQTQDPNEFSVCSGDCRYIDNDTSIDCAVIDGVYWCSSAGWEPLGLPCSSSPNSPTTGASGPPSDSDGDGTSDGFDSSPNNPGSGGGGGADGESQPEDGQCGRPGQPECGTPGSGSGNGNTSGGGGSCSSPPSSTGDPILAQIAYQTWATRCAVEGLGKGEGGGQPEWTKGNPPPVPEDGTDYVEGSKRFGIGLSPDLLDRENIFGAGSCPQFSVSVLSATVSTADFPAWCSVIAPAMRGLILLMGAFTALGILLGRFGV